ncbi:MAG: hypothetical protein R3D46_00640 [Defluviimonas denitrificans]
MKTFKIMVAACPRGGLRPFPRQRHNHQRLQTGDERIVDGSGSNGWYQSTSYTLNGTGRAAAAGMFR